MPACLPALLNGSKRYQLRAHFGDNVVELEDPYRFPPVLSEFDLDQSSMAPPPAHLRQARRAPDDARGVDGVAFVASTENARRQRGRRFQFLNAGGIRCGCSKPAIGSRIHPHARVGDHYKFDIISRSGRQHLPPKSDPLAFAGVAAQRQPIVVDQSKIPATGGRRRRVSTRSARRCRSTRFTSPAARRATMEWSDLSRTGLSSFRPMHAILASLHSIPARQRTSVRRLMGISADRVVRADQPVRLAGGFCRADRCLPPRRLTHARLGTRALPRRSARPRPFLMAPRFTNTPIRCRADTVNQER